MPLPESADYAGLYYQIDGQSILPVRLAWMTTERSIDNWQTCPFCRINTEPWEWTDEDLDLSIHDDAEEYFLQWASACWNEAGGKNYLPLFVLYDHGCMDLYDLSTLEEISDNDVEQRISRKT